MDADTKASAYHTEAYNKAGVAMMDFTPVKQVHQHLCGLHKYAHDPSRLVESHHFCSHPTPDFHQCIIYDSDKPDARLIGIEYIVTDKVFNGLPAEEKRYWHSHKFEVEGGALTLVPKGIVPEAAVLEAEQPAMLNLRKTYGKTIHTWQSDIHPDLPLGPPSLMMAVHSHDDMPEDARQKAQKVQQHRESYLPLNDGYQASSEADFLQNNPGKKLELDLETKAA